MTKPLLLVHIPKTAGRSVSENGRVPVINVGHQFAKDIPNIDDYYSFCFVRNPYDRFMSSYYFYKQLYKGKRLGIKKGVKIFRGFDHFVRNFESFEFKDDLQFTPQCKFIEGVDMDYIGRFEMIEYDWKIIVFTALGKMPKPLPHINASKHRPWEYEYNQVMKDKVYEMYKKDFELFTYEK